MFRSEVLLVSYILICSVFASPQNTDDKDEKIVGGTEANINNFKYQVAVLADKVLCGGSLIDKNWVLTAANCVYNKFAKDFTIVLGSATANTGGLRLKVKKITRHEKYNHTTKANDIAIMQLTKAITNHDMEIYPIALIGFATSLPGDGVNCIVSGYGNTSFQGPAATSLRQVTVKIINYGKCNTNYGGVLTGSMFCAGLPNGGKDACQGDSGGPLVRNGKQIGIVSWGEGCAAAKYPRIYTSIPSMLTWINNKV